MRILSKAVSLITIIISIHYFYSYRMLTGLLEFYHLKYMSIITFEDVAYPLGNLNLAILRISGMGLIWIFLWNLLIDNEKQFRKNMKSILNRFSNKVCKWIIKTFKINKKVLPIIIVIIVIIISSLIGFLIFFVNYKAGDKGSLMILYLVNFIFIPVLYILCRKKRELISGLYLGFVFFFGVYFIDDSYKRNQNDNIKDQKIKEIVSFSYNSQSFQTSKDTVVIFNGYKYLILNTKSKGVYDLIPKQEIKDLKIKIVNN